jgi:type II secretory pathway pseudopilin PulG
MMKRNSGISLIVLVITIIVIIILAGTVILSLADNNPIAAANEARFETNVSEYNSQLAMALTNEQLKDNTFNSSTFDKTTWEGGETLGTIKECIPNITDNDAKKFKIEDGILVYVGGDETEAIWAAKAGATVEPQGLGVNVIATENATVDNKPYAYNNPIIPKGFKAINTLTATWPAGWNEGLVIEDGNGNQFVWVPVDGTTVSYTKNYVDYPSDIATTNTWEDGLPNWVNSADTVTKYGGFYIARYESRFDYNDGTYRVTSKPSNGATCFGLSLTSDYNGYLWNFINYADAKANSESMGFYNGYDYNVILTHLITGIQWDTTMKWMSNSGINVNTNSSAWGNYPNTVDISGLSFSGTNETYKAKNIYDLAGNIWEWTTEVRGDDSKNIVRGGSWFDDGTGTPASYRKGVSDQTCDADYGFRVVLYLI